MRLAEIEKLAVEIAELASRETALNAESARILDELSAVRATKAQKLQRLASGSNGSSPGGPAMLQGALTDAKERVYRMVADEPSRVFTVQDACELLKLRRSTASVYLSELAKEGRIHRLATGKYQAQPPQQPSSVAPGSAATPKGDDGAWPAKISALLATAPARTFSAPEIAKHFGVRDASGINTVRGALSRLSRSGRIMKAGHGGYKANAANVEGGETAA